MVFCACCTGAYQDAYAEWYDGQDDDDYCLGCYKKAQIRASVQKAGA